MTCSPPWRFAVPTTACAKGRLPVQIENISACCTRASTTSESDVEMALQLLEEEATLPTCEAVRGLVDPVAVPQVVLAPVNLHPYDHLLPDIRYAHG